MTRTTTWEYWNLGAIKQIQKGIFKIKNWEVKIWQQGNLMTPRKCVSNLIKYNKIISAQAQSKEKKHTLH